jgi:hypothetical protein
MERLRDSVELWIPTSIPDEVEPKKEKNIKKHEITNNASTYRLMAQGTQRISGEFYKPRADSSDKAWIVGYFQQSSPPEMYSHIIHIASKWR